MAGVGNYIERDVLGRRIELLGVSRPIDVTQTGIVVPIFTCGDIRFPARDIKRVCIPWIGFSTTGSLAQWSIGSGAAANDYASGINGIGTLLYAGQVGYSVPTYTPGDVLNCKVTVAGTGTAIVSAYGWSE